MIGPIKNGGIPYITAEPVAKQEIRKSISQLYRIKDVDGKEWLFYQCRIIWQ